MVLVIDPQIAGISGDMILCALVDLGADKSRVIGGIKAAEEFLGTGVKRIDFARTKRGGTAAVELLLEMDDDPDGRDGGQIRDCISKTCRKIGLSKKACDFAGASITALIEAESRIHGEPEDSVHFHEAGSFDTVADIVGTAVALEDLGLLDEEIITMPVAVGSGSVTFSHGTASNPAGAILEIFKRSGIIISGNGTDSELTTPTGACILQSLAGTCREFYPVMKVGHTGYGAGKKTFEGFANVLKLVRGTKKSHIHDTVRILETNVDDVSGEVLGHLIDKLIKHGAKDVTVSAAITKKGRPTHMVTVICGTDTADSLTKLLFAETGTLGVRTRSSERITAPRSPEKISIMLDGQDFTINYKTNDDSGSFKIEFDDLRRVSECIQRPLRETEELIRNEINKKTA